MPVFDVKTEKELTAEEIAELILKYVKEKNWIIASYYTRLLARELANLLAQQRRPQLPPPA